MADGNGSSPSLPNVKPNKTVSEALLNEKVRNDNFRCFPLLPQLLSLPNRLPCHDIPLYDLPVAHVFEDCIWA